MERGRKGGREVRWKESLFLVDGVDEWVWWLRAVRFEGGLVRRARNQSLDLCRNE